MGTPKKLLVQQFEITETAERIDIRLNLYGQVIIESVEFTEDSTDLERFVLFTNALNRITGTMNKIRRYGKPYKTKVKYFAVDENGQYTGEEVTKHFINIGFTKKGDVLP